MDSTFLTCPRPSAPHWVTAVWTILALGACTAQAGPRQELAVSASPWSLGAEGGRFVLPLQPGSAPRLQAALARSGPGTVALRFERLRAEASRGLYYEIYLNLPPGAPAPGAESPHYAGNLVLFGQAPGEEWVQELPLSAPVKALRRSGLWSEGELSVTFVPRGAPGPAAPSVRIGRVALTCDG
jgi:hypothetical protein